MAQYSSALKQENIGTAFLEKNFDVNLVNEQEITV